MDTQLGFGSVAFSAETTLVLPGAQIPNWLPEFRPEQRSPHHRGAGPPFVVRPHSATRGTPSLAAGYSVSSIYLASLLPTTPKGRFRKATTERPSRPHPH
jgi:hypothetical protein